MIKKVAAGLPESFNVRRIRKTVRGHEITDEQLKRLKMKREKLDPKGFYQIIENEMFAIDHMEELKAAYKAKGNQGMYEYCVWLPKHNKMMFKKYGKGDPAKWEWTNGWLQTIIDGGPSKIWSVFQAYLSAFGSGQLEPTEDQKRDAKFPNAHKLPNGT